MSVDVVKARGKTGVANVGSAADASAQAQAEQEALRQAAEQARLLAQGALALLNDAENKLSSLRTHSPQARSAIHEAEQAVRAAEGNLDQALRQAHAAAAQYQKVSGETTPLPSLRAANDDGMSMAGLPDLRGYSGEPQAAPLEDTVPDGTQKKSKLGHVADMLRDLQSQQNGEGVENQNRGEVTQNGQADGAQRSYQLTQVNSAPDAHGQMRDIYRMTVEGRTIDIAMDKAQLEAGKNQNTPDQVAQAIARLPPELFAEVDRVELHNQRNPDDAFWATEYHQPDFTSIMTSGADGTVNIYPSDKPQSVATIADNMMHETGHVWSKRRLGEDQNSAPWQAYMAAAARDGAAATTYSTKSVGEDIADFTRLYFETRGTPQAQTLQKQFPNRYAFIENDLQKNGGKL